MLRVMRTGLTHVFKRQNGVNRKAAEEVWRACREGRKTSPTTGDAPGFVQANLVAVRSIVHFSLYQSQSQLSNDNTGTENVRV